jgi:hypothetical protein
VGSPEVAQQLMVDRAAEHHHRDRLPAAIPARGEPIHAGDLRWGDAAQSLGRGGVPGNVRQAHALDQLGERSGLLGLGRHLAAPRIALPARSRQPAHLEHRARNHARQPELHPRPPIVGGLLEPAPHVLAECRFQKVAGHLQPHQLGVPPGNADPDLGCPLLDRGELGLRELYELAQLLSGEVPAVVLAGGIRDGVGEPPDLCPPAFGEDQRDAEYVRRALRAARRGSPESPSSAPRA